MELLVVEVHHYRGAAASRRDRGAWGLRKICPNEICFWAINIGNDKKKNISTLYITDFKRLLVSLVGQNLSLDAQVTSGLGEWVSI